MLRSYRYELFVAACFAFVLIVGFYQRWTGKEGTSSWDANPFTFSGEPARVAARPVPAPSPMPVRAFPGPTPSPGTGENVDIAAAQVQGQDALLRLMRAMYPQSGFEPMKLPGGGEIHAFSKSAALGCAFVGRQHYEYLPHFHEKPEKVEELRESVRRRRETCKSLGIRLVEVPYNTRDMRGWVTKAIAKMAPPKRA